MSRQLALWGSVCLLASLASACAAFAQSAATDTGTASNEVFLGQTGDTNILTVTQTGSGHLVGGNGETLRLNQLGNLNKVDIFQVGADNGIGRENMIGQPGGLTGIVGTATGLFQHGDSNFLDIIQRSHRNTEGSQIGAIDQRAQSASGLIPSDGSANRAVIRQTGGAFLPLVSDRGESTGAARHVIREISQVHRPTRSNAAPNSLEVSQTGERQEAGQLRQSGVGNNLTLTQEGLANSLRLGEQTGENNKATIVSMGERNTLGNAEQHGTSDQMSLRLDGTGNFIDQVVQAGLGSQGEGRGNSVFVSVMGNDNGGEGIGGYSAVSSQSAVSGAFASSLEQFGEGNTLSLTIGSDGSGRADGNFFSFVQRGLDNAAYALLTGDGNEFASSQQGDGNRLDIVQASSAIRATGDNQRAGNTALLQQTGDANLADIRQAGAGNGLDMTVIGDRNLLAVSQTGSANRADVRIVGNDNLRPAPRGGRLPSTTDALVKTILQDGTGHRASLDLVGNDNVVSVLQRGAQDIANGIVRGDGNLATVRQEGEKQTLNFIQMGESQSLFVHQQ
ncbi:hypothetical protein [Aureimonas sp. AU20]|uniref:hypothetical protein n=1 Tax=Aureimonas sp. AU20 TaxID=1349819 RepID=UPI00071F617D|nr:hypothetical protein [Aureimonas sp. AU20]ALN74646.1 hypothetical protein M673_18160 [Aureimonas sp. AU20]